MTEFGSYRSASRTMPAFNAMKSNRVGRSIRLKLESLEQLPTVDEHGNGGQVLQVVAVGHVEQELQSRDEKCDAQKREY
jgi:hypothetical protein